ncbi:MAG: 2-hydroxyacyl-CoA dehydratase [Armatimonadetes bacterium]|nr:2-hydroxyacyl-CoA dehydratase [Armatimonadota bacterium]
MDALERLGAHLETRLDSLKEAKRQGRKVIGYTTGGYLPEELVLACDAIPIGYVRSGDNNALRDAGAYICRWIDPFWRSQIGYLTSKKDPYYNIADLIVIPITDNHVRAFSNTIVFYTPEIESFQFGVPHVKDELALGYYLDGLKRLKNKLEKLTGVGIGKQRLKKAIQLCNRERELFSQISMLRKADGNVVPSRDFIALHHGSFLADKEVMVEILESYLEEAEGREPLADNVPRILLTGSTLASGDTKLLDLIEDCGGMVVMEEFAEGLRPYRTSVGLEDDLMEALAKAYLMERVCPGWFRPGTERLDLLVELVGDYRASGLIWYQLMYRESYKVESYFFPQILKQKTGLNMLVLESEYDTAAELGTMRTRIETYIETIRT